MQPRTADKLTYLFERRGFREWPDPVDLLQLLRTYPALSENGMDAKYFGNTAAARSARRQAVAVNEPDVDFFEFHRAYWWVKGLAGRKRYQSLTAIVIRANDESEHGSLSVGAVLAACLLNDLKVRASSEGLEVNFVVPA